VNASNTAHQSQEDNGSSSILLLESLLRAEGNNANNTSSTSVISMSALQFAEYWLLEDRFDRLNDFLNETFPQRALLIERSSSQSCRYRIMRQSALSSAQPIETEKNELADVFANFEAHKQLIGIQEYSVGQTTLEQIFNQFAAKQYNPDGH
jgi:hypothetical protein